MPESRPRRGPTLTPPARRLAFVISALGSIKAWAHRSNYAGIDWSMSDAARSAIVLAIGVGGGLATVLLGYATRSAPARPGVAARS